MWALVVCSSHMWPPTFAEQQNTQFWRKWAEYSLGPEVISYQIEWAKHGGRGELHPSFFTIGNRQLRERIIGQYKPKSSHERANIGAQPSFFTIGQNFFFFSLLEIILVFCRFCIRIWWFGPIAKQGFHHTAQVYSNIPEPGNAVKTVGYLWLEKALRYRYNQLGLYRVPTVMGRYW
jgi:hypothetical protein